MHPSKVTEEKLLWKEEIAAMCEQGKFPLHFRPSLGQMGKQFHAGAVKPEPGFCGSGVGFFQSVRCPIRWTKVTDALGTRLSECQQNGQNRVDRS